MTDWFYIFMINIGLKSSLIFLFGWLLQVLLKKWRAAHRYAVWKILCGLLLLLPLTYLIAWQPTLYTPEPTEIIEDLPVPYRVLDLSNEKSSLPTTQLAAQGTSLEADTANSKSIYRSTDPLFLCIVFGIALLGLFMVAEAIILAYIIRKSHIGHDEIWEERMVFHKSTLGLLRPVQLVFSDYIKIPFTYGWKKPIILIPESEREWTTEEIDTIILHELCHIRQGDFAFNVILQLIKCLYWWHPLCWWAIKKIRLTCEQSCDESVVNAGITHLAYAQQLVQLADRFQVKSNWRAQLSVPMLRNTDLKNRVTQLLRLARDQQSEERTKIPARIFGSTLCLIPLLFLNLPAGESGLNASRLGTLLLHLEKPDVGTKVASLKALGIRKYQRALIPVLEHLEHPDPRVRAAAAWALGEMGDDQAIVPLVNLINDRVDCVQERALLSLGTFGSTKTFYAVTDGRNDGSPVVRKATLWTLYRIGCMPAFHLVSNHLDDPDEGVRMLSERLIRNFDSRKLKNWILGMNLDYGRDFAYEHFSGIQKTGCTELFVERLSGQDDVLAAAVKQAVAETPHKYVIDAIQDILANRVEE